MRIKSGGKERKKIYIGIFVLPPYVIQEWDCRWNGNYGKGNIWNILHTNGLK
jgi:hypothetical protein